MGGKRFLEAEFVDDYRLLVIIRAARSQPPALEVVDTEKGVGEYPTETVFLFPLCIGNFGRIHLHLEPGSHEPSPAESLAPFHQDHSQRIAVLYIEQAPHYLVLRLGELLEFKTSGQSDIGWDVWKRCVVVPSIDREKLIRSDVWVSGCRLFSVYQRDSTSHVNMEVFDFSVQGRAKYLSDTANEEFGGLRYLSSTGTIVQIPWEDRFCPCSGHDSLLFSIVSVIVLFSFESEADWNAAHCRLDGPWRGRGSACFAYLDLLTVVHTPRSQWRLEYGRKENTVHITRQ